MSQSQSQQVSEQDKTRPWWRYPIVWMVVGGPAAVVVASLYTAGLAIKHVDPVLDTTADNVLRPSEAPAVKGRDQAAELATAPAEK